MINVAGYQVLVLQLVAQVAQYAVLIVKYAKDQRYDETGIATHCGQVQFKG